MRLHFRLTTALLVLAAPFAAWPEPRLVSAPDDPFLLGTAGSHSSLFCSLSSDGNAVAFESDSIQLVPGDTNGAKDVFLRNRANASLGRVSVLASGEENARGGSEAALSSNGRFIAFLSSVDPDSGLELDHSHLWWLDQRENVFLLATRRPDGAPGNSRAGSPAISPTGRFVSFFSRATDLVPGGSSDVGHLFVFDALTGVVQIASTSATGEEANAVSYQSGVSADGRYVGFESNASNLVPGDTNNARDVFVKDLHSGDITRVSVSSAGGQSNGGSDFLGISADGDKVLLSSSANNLVPGDTNGGTDIFLHSLTAGTTTRVNVRSNGTQSTASSHGAMSADSMIVLFNSGDDALDGPTGGHRQMFAKDMSTGAVTRLTSVASGNVLQFSLSADGSTACFASNDDALTAGDVNNVPDIFVVSLEDGTLERASQPRSAVPMTSGNARSFEPDIGADGDLVVFGSDAILHDATFDAYGVLPPGQVYLRNMTGNGITLVSTRTDGTPTAGYNARPRISGNGRYVAWESHDDGLSPDDDNAEADIYRKDLTSGEVVLVSFDAEGAASGGRHARISGDGSQVAFIQEASGTAGSFDQIYLWDVVDGIQLISATPAGVPGNGDSMDAEISPDGRFVLFTSEATDLVAAGSSGQPALYLRDVPGGTTIALAHAVAGPAHDGVDGRATLSGDGSRVAFIALDDANDRRDLYLADLAAATLQRLPIEQLTAHGDAVHPASPTLSSDGSHLAFWLMDDAEQGDIGLWRLDIDSGDYVRLLQRSGPVNLGQWRMTIRMSANGTRLAFDHPDQLVAEDINGPGTMDVYHLTARRNFNTIFASGFEPPR